MKALLRATATCLIVLLCGAFTCLRLGDGIQYAPGYGYVVKLDGSWPPRWEHLYYYRVFDTYEQAKHFVDTRYTDPSWPGTGVGRTYENENDQIEYDKITKLLGPPPLYEAPLANPDLPEPIPPTPQ